MESFWFSWNHRRLWDIGNEEEKAEMKRPLGDISRVVMGRSPSSLVVETSVGRPSRACSSRRRLPDILDGAAFMSSSTPPLPRMSSKASYGYAVSTERLSSLPIARRMGVRAMSLALATSVAKERLELRSLWEMAAVMNFFSVFRHIINNLPEFTMEELESAFLNPNSVLDTIHVVLLKGIPPAARVPLRGDTWPMILCKKFKDWWRRVADGPCPLLLCQGAELATYLELDASTRVRVLLALCEIRVDQDDARSFIDESMKRIQLATVVRKDRSGCGAEGTTFWLEEDALMGQRLYREGQATIPAPPLKNKGRGWGRGRNMPPPVLGSWETVATNLEEFQEVSTRLLESPNRLESAMGKKLMQSLMPQLEEIQKKKDRMVKKQLREAVLLDTMLQGNGLASGRSRRERKRVTYTFDEFDRSISEAIKFTKKNVPETSMRHVYGNGVNEVDGLGRERNGNVAHEQVGFADGGGVGVRRSSRNSRLHLDPELAEEGDAGDPRLEPHLVVADSGFSDDEIEGEAVYDDDYLAARQRKENFSSERGESLRGDGDDADFDGDGEGEKYGKENDQYEGDQNGGESDGLESEVGVRKRSRRSPKVRLVNDISCEAARRNVSAVFDRTTGSEESSDFDEQIVRDAHHRLQMVERGRTESSAQGSGQNIRGTVDVGLETASDSHDVSGYSSEMRNRESTGLVDGKRTSGLAFLLEEHFGEHLVRRSAQPEENQQEADYVEFDEEECTRQEVEKREGSRRRRQFLDLNEVAPAARRSRLLSEDGESEYSKDELPRCAEAD